MFAAVDQLEYLDKKFNVPDAAPTEFDVPLAATLPDFGHFFLYSNKPLQVGAAQGTHEGKGAHPGQEVPPDLFIARYTPGAQPCQPLPRFGARLVITLCLIH